MLLGASTVLFETSDGGSLVFNAIMVKPRRELFERLFPSEIDFDEMEDVYYPRVKRILRSSPGRFFRLHKPQNYTVAHK